MGLVLVVGGGAWLVHRTDPEVQQVRQVVDELANAVGVHPGEAAEARRARIEAAVATRVLGNARLILADRPDVSTPDARFVASLVGLVQRQEQAAVELRDVRIAVRGQSAHVTLDALLEGDTGRDLHARQRHVTMQLVKQDGQWRVAAVEVPSQVQAEPEPRP